MSTEPAPLSAVAVYPQVSWQCVGASPNLRYALGTLQGDYVADVRAVVWRDTKNGAWNWQSAGRTGHEPTKGYAMEAAEAELLW